MADFNPYASQQAAIARQQKMADILQQQAFQPQEAGSYNGIPAALPAWGGLAKALQGYMGGLQGKRAEAGQAALGVQQKADQDRSAAALAAVLNGDPVGPLDPTGLNPDDLRTATALTAQRQAAAAAEQRAQARVVEQRAYDATKPENVTASYTYTGDTPQMRDTPTDAWHSAVTPEMDAANKAQAGTYKTVGRRMGQNGPIETDFTERVVDPNRRLSNLALLQQELASERDPARQEQLKQAIDKELLVSKTVTGTDGVIRQLMYDGTWAVIGRADPKLIGANAAAAAQGNVVGAGAGAQTVSAQQAGVMTSMLNSPIVYEPGKPPVSIDDLLKEATDSWTGRTRDQVLAVFGATSQAGLAAKKLDVIAAQLLSKVPRFKGQDSDSDVRLYEKMAGDLANRSITGEARQAALDTLRSLEAKAAMQNGLTPQGATPKGAIPMPTDKADMRPGVAYILPNGEIRTWNAKGWFE